MIRFPAQKVASELRGHERAHGRDGGGWQGWGGGPAGRRGERGPGGLLVCRLVRGGGATSPVNRARGSRGGQEKEQPWGQV